MIKLNYNNGTLIEFDSVSEVKEFLEVTEKVEKAPTKVVRTPTLSKFQKAPTTGIIAFERNVHRRKRTQHNLWTVEEVRYICDHLESDGRKSVETSNFLSRHSLLGNRQMIWKVKSNPKSYRVTPEIQTLIDAYHGKF